MGTGAGTEGETGGGYLRGSEDASKKQERSTLVKLQYGVFPLHCLCDTAQLHFAPFRLCSIRIRYHSSVGGSSKQLSIPSKRL